jgi:hypothetical protein
MGVTIFFKIRTARHTSAADARRLVNQGRKIAERMSLRQAFDHVGPLMPATAAKVNAVRFVDFPVPGSQGNKFIPLEVSPSEGFVFRVDVGRDCEPLWLGLCRYPAEAPSMLGMLKTGLQPHWQFDGSSKTQYSSLSSSIP